MVSRERRSLAPDAWGVRMKTRQLALVTGAGRGIGAALSEQLAARGHAVLVTARHLDAAEAHAAALRGEGNEAEAYRLDVTDPASIVEVARAVGERPLDLLVNNAAAFADWSETASTADLELTKAIFDANVVGPWRVTQAMLPALRRANQARVVNVGSGSGSHGDPQYGLGTGPAAASYAVSKAALHALTRKLAAELAADGIRVIAADPDLTATAPGMEAMGARPVADGAASIVWAATAPDAATGGFYRDGEVLPW
jgi:NAD(P)-dependent dehydrogenase (short-subunit alcohol dehydrogenase family)